MKELIARLAAEDPGVEENLFRSLHRLRPETLPGWKTGGERHLFVEDPEGEDGKEDTV